MLAQRIWSNAVFLVKSYGKLRNCFLKVCWYVFCVSGAVFSKSIWKTTKLLFENPQGHVVSPRNKDGGKGRKSPVKKFVGTHLRLQ